MVKFVIRKDVYDELIEKGFGKKDLSKLTKVQITDKNGHTRNVYRKMGEEPKDGKKGKQEVEVKEKTSKLKVPKETTKKATKGIDYETAKQAMKEGKEVQWRSVYSEDWNTVEPGTSELIMARDIGAELRIKPNSNYSVGQEISFEYGGNTLKGSITAIGEVGVTVKDNEGKVYKVNFDEISKVEKEDKPIFNADKYMQALDQMKKIENAYKKQKEEYDFYERTGTLDRRPYYVQKPKDLTENSDYMGLKKYVDAFK